MCLSKPLINRLLLENSNQSIEQASETSRKELVPDWNLDGSAIDWVTPQKSEDVRKQAHQIMELEDIDIPTRRVLFQKVAKGLDEKDFVIA